MVARYVGKFQGSKFEYLSTCMTPRQSTLQSLTVVPVHKAGLITQRPCWTFGFAGALERICWAQRLCSNVLGNIAQAGRQPWKAFFELWVSCMTCFSYTETLRRLHHNLYIHSCVCNFLFCYLLSTCVPKGRKFWDALMIPSRTRLWKMRWRGEISTVESLSRT